MQNEQFSECLQNEQFSVCEQTITDLMLLLLVLKHHVVIRLKTDASSENVDDALSLLGESVDNGSSSGHFRSLQEIAENGEDGVEVLETLASFIAHSDTLADLSENNEIHHQRSSQQGVLTSVMHGDGVQTAIEDFRSVLIESTLAITHKRNVLDDDQVIGLLSVGIENTVGGNHIVHNTGLGDLLRAELLRGGEILAIIITKMVVRSNGGGLDTSTHQVINKHRLDLGLTTLEVITGDESLVLLSQLENTRNKSVLRRTIDIGISFKNGSNGEDSGGSHFRMASLDSVKEVFSSIVHTRNDIGVTFRIGGPQDNHLVQLVFLLETAHISTNMLQVSLLVISGNDVISSIALIRSNVIRVVNGRHGHKVLHMRIHDLLEVIVIDSSTLHGITKVHRANIPTTNNKVIRVYERKQSIERNVEIASRNSTHLNSRTLRDRAIIVRVLDSLLRVPGDVELVSKNTSRNSGTIVTTPTNKHHTNLGNTSISLEHKLLILGRNDHLAIFYLSFARMINIIGGNGVISVGDIGSINNNRRIGVLISRIHYKS